jgi:hypothetical protein
MLTVPAGVLHGIYWGSFLDFVGKVNTPQGLTILAPRGDYYVAIGGLSSSMEAQMLPGIISERELGNKIITNPNTVLVTSGEALILLRSRLIAHYKEYDLIATCFPHLAIASCNGRGEEPLKVLREFM